MATNAWDCNTIWEKADFGDRMIDVAFTKTGNLAVTDCIASRVMLIDGEGELLADSSALGVSLSRPHGIEYHPAEDAFLVCDYKGGCVKVLDANSLQQKRTIKLETISDPWGIGVLSSGNIVVTEGTYEGMSKVGVFDMHGRQRITWNRHGEDNNMKFGFPHYVAVDRLDHFYISDWGQDMIIKFSDVRGYLSAWNTKSSPWGMAVQGDILLVAQWGNIHERKCPMDHADFLMAYNLEGQNGREVYNWNSQLPESDKIKSVVVRKDKLAVLGLNKLNMCRSLLNSYELYVQH